MYLLSSILILFLGVRVSALLDMKPISKSEAENAERNATLRRSPALSWERDLEPASLENRSRYHYMKNYSWEQDPDYSPASIIAENKFMHHNASFGPSTRNHVSQNGNQQPRNYGPHKGQQHPRAKIEFIDEASQEPGNNKPYFRTQMDHSGIVPQQSKVPDVARAHSRESYLHSQAFVASKNRLNKPRSLSQNKEQGLSIDAGVIQDVVTVRPRKGFDRVNQQISLKMQSTEESIEDVTIPNNNENPYYDKKGKHIDKDKNNNKNHYYEDSYHDKHQIIPYNHKNVNQNYLPRDKKRYEVQNEINKLKTSLANSDDNKKKVEKQNENNNSRVRSHSDDDEYLGGKKEKQKQLSQKDWDSIPKNKKFLNKAQHRIVNKLTRLRPDRTRGRYEGDYGYQGHNSGRNRERYRSKGSSDQSQEGSYQSDIDYSREKPKHNNYNKNINKVSDKHEGYDKYKNVDKKYKSNIRVTEGIHAEQVNKESTRSKHTSKSYESIEMKSEDNSNFGQVDKISGQIHPTVHPKLYMDVQLGTNNRKPASELEENEVFQPYSIAKQLDFLKKRMSDCCAIIDQEIIGRTVEYNQIVLWKMREKPEETVNFRASMKKKKYAEEPPEKKIIFIVHGLTVMGWHKLDCLSKIKRFETLLRYYIENLDSFDIYLIPMANPDGVAKALATQPWNKNVSPQNACPGVNLDRNFDVGWNGTYTAGKGTSCRQTYPGPHPFSEHETRAIREVFHRFGHKIVAYFHVHAGSYDSGVFKGDAVLYPKGYTERQSGDDNYVDLKGDIDDGMRNTSFTVLSVSVDTLYNWYGMVQGTSVDYASSVYGIPYAMELVMQLYADDTTVSDEDQREKHTALTEIWQLVLDVMFDSIYKHAIKPNEI